MWGLCDESFPVSRRYVLSAVAGMTGITGCSRMSDEEPTPSTIRISTLEVENRDDSSHVVTVLLQRGAELLFWDELPVEETGEREIYTNCVERDEWEEPSQYFVRARLDDDSSWIELDTVAQAREHAYEEQEYMNIRILVPNDGDYGFQTYDENYECGSPQ